MHRSRGAMALVLLLMSCSSGSDSGSDPAASTGSTATTPGEDVCRGAGEEAAGVLQDFVDRYDDLTVAEWNALDPAPDVEGARTEAIAVAQRAIDDGCDAADVEAALLEGTDQLRGASEVGQSIIAIFRGEGPPTGPFAPNPVTTAPRDNEISTVQVSPGDDLGSIVARIAPGSTLEFSPGVFEFDETIVLDVDVRLDGAGTDKTTIRSTAAGAAIAFFGPGGLDIGNMAIEHTGAEPASVLVVVEGPVSVRSVKLSGGIAGDAVVGGGHGMVYAFADVDGLPDRTSSERSGALTIERSVISGNAAAGVLATGDAAPIITDTTISDNGTCGVCVADTARSEVISSALTGNDIGVQLDGGASVELRNSDISASTRVGVLAGATSQVTMLDSRLDGNGEIGIQVGGTATADLTGNAITRHEVGVLVVESADVSLTTNLVNDHRIGVQAGATSVLSALDNTIWVSELAGVSISDETTATISGNSVAGAGTAAVQVLGAAEVEVSDNSVDGTGEVGISFAETASGAITENEIAGVNVGIQIGDAAAPDISGNTIREPREIGVLLSGATTAFVAENRISRAPTAGVVAAGSSAAVVRDNTIIDSEVGIIFRDDASGTTSENSIERQAVGIQIADQAAPVIADNAIRTSRDVGVVFGGSTGAIFRGNVVSGSSNLSLQVGGSATPEIVDNDVRGPGAVGILYFETAAGTASGNRLVALDVGAQIGGRSKPALLNNTIEGIVLAGVVYVESGSGSATGNRCTPASAAGISVAAPANPTLTDNSCAVTRP